MHNRGIRRIRNVLLIINIIHIRRFGLMSHITGLMDRRTMTELHQFSSSHLLGASSIDAIPIPLSDLLCTRLVLLLLSAARAICPASGSLQAFSCQTGGVLHGRVYFWLSAERINTQSGAGLA